MSQIILISNKNQLERVNLVFEKGKKENILILEDYIEYSLEEINAGGLFNIITIRSLLDQNKIWLKCQKAARDLFTEWNLLKINNKNIFNEILGFKGISLLEIDALSYFSSHSEYLANIIFKITVIDELFKKKKVSKVILFSPYTIWEKICILYSEQNEIEIIEVGRKGKKNYRYSNESIYSIQNLKIMDVKLTFKINLNLLPPLIRMISILRRFKKKVLPIKKKVLPIKKKIHIFLLLFNEKYLDLALPLIKSILRDDKFQVLVILLNSNRTIENILVRMNLDYIILNKYATNKILKKSYSNYKQIIKSFNKIFRRTEFLENFYFYKEYYMGNILLKKIKESIFLSYPYIKIYYLMKSVIDIYSPRVLITTNVPLRESLIISKACKDSNMKVIGIERAVGGKFTEFSMYDDIDNLIVAGNYARDSFKFWNFDDNKIEITGMPIFDDLLKKMSKKQSIKKNFKRRFSIKPESKIITYLTQPESFNFGFKEKIHEIKIVFETISKLGNVFLVIKMHPSESNPNLYLTLAQDFNLRDFVITQNDINLGEILISSDVALTKTSLTGFDALIAECSLLILGFHNQHFVNNFFIEANIAYPIRKKEELELFLGHSMIRKNNLEKKKNNKKFLEDFFFKFDFKSQERMKKIIYKQLVER